MSIHTSIKFRADTVTDEERDAATTLLIQSDLQGLGNGVLARVVQASEEQDKALLRARRVALTERPHNGSAMKMSARFFK